MVEPRLVKTGQAIPLFYDPSSPTASAAKADRGPLDPGFPELYRQIKGTLPSGKLLDAYLVPTT